MRFKKKTISQLEKRLRSPKPGLSAQLLMATRPRPGQKIYTEVEKTCLKAGVLLFLYPRRDSLHLVLIRRTATVLHHKDQIGFPGGQVEGQENFVEAALREAHEEIGVPPERIRVIGALTPLYVPPSNFCIYPVVGASGAPFPFKADPEEVAEIIEVPVSILADPDTSRLESWTIEGRSIEVPFYAFGAHKIWGATAMVLAEFMEVLKDSSKAEREPEGGNLFFC